MYIVGIVLVYSSFKIKISCIIKYIYGKALRIGE